MALRTEVVESGKEAEDEEAERQHDEHDNVGGLYHWPALNLNWPQKRYKTSFFSIHLRILQKFQLKRR